MAYTRDTNFTAVTLGILRGRFAVVFALLASYLVP